MAMPFNFPPRDMFYYMWLCVVIRCCCFYFYLLVSVFHSFVISFCISFCICISWMHSHGSSGRAHTDIDEL